MTSIYLLSLNKRICKRPSKWGLQVDEVRERIKQPGRAGIEGLNRIMDGDIVNATGLAPFDEAETGDVVSNIRFSTRRRNQLGDLTTYCLTKNCLTS